MTSFGHDSTPVLHEIKSPVCHHMKLSTTEPQRRPIHHHFLPKRKDLLANNHLGVPNIVLASQELNGRRDYLVIITE